MPVANNKAWCSTKIEHQIKLSNKIGHHLLPLLADCPLHLNLKIKRKI